jgi:hypothetical protein
MRSVGGFYLLLPVALLPPFLEAGLPLVYPGLRAAPGSVEARAAADAWWLLALGLGVVGWRLLLGARDPIANLPLVRLVLAWEAVVGVVGGLFCLARGDMAPAVALGSLVPPLVILATGWWVLQSPAPER